MAEATAAGAEVAAAGAEGGAGGGGGGGGAADEDDADPEAAGAGTPDGWPPKGPADGARGVSGTSMGTAVDGGGAFGGGGMTVGAEAAKGADAVMRFRMPKAECARTKYTQRLMSESQMACSCRRCPSSPWCQWSSS